MATQTVVKTFNLSGTGSSGYAPPTLLVIQPRQATTSLSVFFPDPSTLVPPPHPTEIKSNVTKTVLEFVFLAIALVAVGCIIFRRFVQLRRGNRQMTGFFSMEGGRGGQDAPRSRVYPRTTGIVPPLTALPATYQGPGHRTRGAHIDDAGRRLDGWEGDKDLLPAYDSYGGPPKYNALEMQVRLPSVGEATDPGRDDHPYPVRNVGVDGPEPEQHALPGGAHEDASPPATRPS